MKTIRHSKPRLNATPTPTGFTEIVGDGFPVLHLMSSVAPFRRTALVEPYGFFGAGEATSFWKRGSFRSGSNIGSSRSSAGVSGMPEIGRASCRERGENGEDGGWASEK